MTTTPDLSKAIAAEMTRLRNNFRATNWGQVESEYRRAFLQVGDVDRVHRTVTRIVLEWNSQFAPKPAHILEVARSLPTPRAEQAPRPAWSDATVDRLLWTAAYANKHATGDTRLSAYQEIARWHGVTPETDPAEECVRAALQDVRAHYEEFGTCITGTEALQHLTAGVR